VQTTTDGHVRLFAAFDHFNSGVVDRYVSTDGSRFAALALISQAVIARFDVGLGPMQHAVSGRSRH
jgi:hypothetical protein